MSQSWEMMGDEIRADSEGKGDGPGTRAKAREGPSFLRDMGLGQAGTQTHPHGDRALLTDAHSNTRTRGHVGPPSQ